MITIGARRSPLAVAQAEFIAGRLRDLGHDTQLVGITSQGDTDRRRLTDIGGTGVFAAAVRHGLHERMIDIAVHSLKDLPVAAEPGLVVAAIPAREDPRDVLIGADLDSWTNQTVIGTGSPRREAQLRAAATARGLTVQFQPIRGNVDTRIALVTSGELSATVLARAGLVRLDRHPDSATILDIETMVPAPGQGALAVECRADDDQLRLLLADLDHADTRAAVTAERTFLSALEAGCLAPVGAYAHVRDHQLHLQVAAAKADGSLVRLNQTLPMTAPVELGASLAARVLARLDGTVNLGGEQAKEPGL